MKLNFLWWLISVLIISFTWPFFHGEAQVAMEHTTYRDAKGDLIGAWELYDSEGLMGMVEEEWAAIIPWVTCLLAVCTAVMCEEGG